MCHFKYGGISNTKFLSEILNINGNEIIKIVKFLVHILPVPLLISLFFGQVNYTIGFFSSQIVVAVITHIKTKRRLLYLEIQSLPRSKHFSS
jgi:hypothetical protein